MKHPGIFDGIESMKVDFDSPDFSETWSDPYADLHPIENDLREKNQVAIFDFLIIGAQLFHLY